jgi:hypothetical protein
VHHLVPAQDVEGVVDGCGGGFERMQAFRQLGEL